MHQLIHPLPGITSKERRRHIRQVRRLLDVTVMIRITDIFEKILLANASLFYPRCPHSSERGRPFINTHTIVASYNTLSHRRGNVLGANDQCLRGNLTRYLHFAHATDARLSSRKKPSDARRRRHELDLSELAHAPFDYRTPRSRGLRPRVSCVRSLT